MANTLDSFRGGGVGFIDWLVDADFSDQCFVKKFAVACPHLSGSSRRKAFAAGVHIVSINLSSSAFPPGISGSQPKIGGSASVKLRTRSGCSVAKNSAVRAP